MCPPYWPTHTVNQIAVINHVCSRRTLLCRPRPATRVYYASYSCVTIPTVASCPRCLLSSRCARLSAGLALLALSVSCSMLSPLARSGRLLIAVVGSCSYCSYPACVCHLALAVTPCTLLLHSARVCHHLLASATPYAHLPPPARAFRPQLTPAHACFPH